MNFDVVGHLGALERAVSSLERDGQPVSAVTLSRSFATTVDDLWDAVTNAERIPRWFLPISGELEPGGRYQLEGNAGGVVTACERPSHFAITWEFGGDVSWVEVRCADEGAGPRAADAHAHCALLSEHWDTYGPGRGRRRLGVGSRGTRAPSRATERAKAGRSRIRHVTGRQVVHHWQQRGVVDTRRLRSEPTPTPRVQRHGRRPRSTRVNRSSVPDSRVRCAPRPSRSRPRLACASSLQPLPPLH